MPRIRVPLIISVSLVATGAPLVAALRHRRALPAARRWIAGWSAFIVAETGLVTLLAMRNINNHWVNYVAAPIEGGLVLWALSLWQTTSLPRLAMRLAIPLLAVTWVGLVLAFEQTDTFSLVADPFAGLLLLAASTYTLIARAFAESGNALEQDWLWVGVGMALYSGIAVALQPASHWLLARHPDLVIRAYEVKAGLEILALLLIVRGMLCPIPATPFGGSSSRGFSPSRSSSSVSSSPS